MKLAETLPYKVNVLTMALDTAGYNEALLWRYIVHHELLHNASVDVTDIVFETEARHTEGFVSVGSAEKQILIVGEGIVLAQVLVQVVALLILGAGNVAGEN